MPTQTLNLTEDERAALERLICIAQADTGQSRKVANFLLAWWNAEECGASISPTYGALIAPLPMTC